MRRAQIHIGTSGWSYPHWAKGVFYPRGLKQGEWLRFFAEHFDTVEVNMTFYRLPNKELLTRWVEMTPARFCFAIKFWRRITHDKKLTGCDDELETFLTTTQSLGSKHGPLLVQLPPSLHCDPERLDAFLVSLRKVKGKRRFPLAVEFRHKSWLCKEVYAVLDRHRAAACLADLARCPITESNDVPFVYVRRHGPGGPYRGCYTEEHLERDAKAIRGWVGEGRDVYAYFNNDVDGHAVANADRLRALVA